MIHGIHRYSHLEMGLELSGSKINLEESLRDGTTDRALVLHMANPGSISCTMFGPLRTSRSNP